MKLKRTDKSKEAKRLRSSKSKVRKLSRDIEALVTEHDFYAFESEAEASDWFHSLPIETLSESIGMDRNLPRQKPSLKDMALKARLRKGYDVKIEKLDTALIELNIANIDFILSKIDGYVR